MKTYPTKRLWRNIFTIAFCFFISASLALNIAVRADGFSDASPPGEQAEISPDMPGKLKLDAGVKKSGSLNLEHVTFYYKTDEEVRFVEKKTVYQSKTRGQLPPEMTAKFAREAYDESSVEQELTRWRYHGGPAPNVITAKAHLFNESQQARLNVKLNVSLRAKVSPMLVDPKTLLVDFDYLKQHGKWEPVAKNSINIAALAAGEDYLEDVIRFELPEFLNKHPNQWPIELEVTVSCPDAGNTVNKSLSLTPDHFVVPVLY